MRQRGSPGSHWSGELRLKSVMIDAALEEQMATTRMSVMGTRHVISAGHYLAAHAGFEILEAGGNAVDAGVAAGVAIGVLQTDKVNFGGVAPQIIYTTKNKQVQCIDGLGIWPRAITPDYFIRRQKPVSNNFNAINLKYRELC